MDKKLLVSLNELQYSDKEIEEIEKQANSQEVDMDKYFIRNAALKRKLAISAIDEYVSKELAEDEVVEKTAIIDSGIRAMPSLYTWGASIYYYVSITNKRLVIVGLDYNYKVVTSYMKSFEEIEGIIEKKKVEMTYGMGLFFKYALVFEEITIPLGTTENKEELREVIELLRSKGVRNVKDRDIDYSRAAVGSYIIFIIIFVVMMVKVISEIL
jgi:hypothetical protein